MFDSLTLVLLMWADSIADMSVTGRLRRLGRSARCGWGMGARVCAHSRSSPMRGRQGYQPITTDLAGRRLMADLAEITGIVGIACGAPTLIGPRSVARSRHERKGACPPVRQPDLPHGVSHDAVAAPAQASDAHETRWRRIGGRTRRAYRSVAGKGYVDPCTMLNILLATW